MPFALEDLTALRRSLHQHAELSGHEVTTASIVDGVLRRCRPDAAVHGLGGHGAAYRFDGEEPGPTVLIRADLDALPIPETVALDHASKNRGVAHKCGHDGHMAMLVGLAASLAEAPLRRGRAILLFQPAEETGEGAALVLADPRFAVLEPDVVVALHNLPGSPMGQVVLRDGTFNCASVGLVATLRGATSHAAEPEAARSPTATVGRLLQELPAVPRDMDDGDALLTLTHAALGEPTFGITPGRATLMATLRAASDATLDELLRRVEVHLSDVAAAAGLDLEVDRREPFRAVVNDAAVVAAVERAAAAEGLDVDRPAHPLRWSEDFAEFTACFPGALVGLGAGLDQPPLHAPSYDFPDALLAVGPRLLRAAVDRLVDVDGT
ncbi:MAG: amidohydrolase [Acidobacteriota bacterium]